jgi:ubiquinone/menaquinone biosynthesis C-methylase UbiE
MGIVERFTPHKGQEYLEVFFQNLINLITPFVKGKKILDAGCGTGYADSFWVKHGAQKIDAYDISAEALDYAEKHYSDKKISFQKKDLNTALFIQNYYDIAVSMEVLEHIKNYRFHLKQLYIALKKGGLLFLSTPNATFTTIENEYHIKEFTYDEIIELLTETGFTVLKTEGLNHNSISNAAYKIIPEGLVPFIKSLPFYSVLVKILFQPAKKPAHKSTTVFLICKKN